MSVQSQIDRINDAVGLSYLAVANQGGDIPSDLSIDNLPGAIQSIGGGSLVRHYAKVLVGNGDTDKIEIPISTSSFMKHMVAGKDWTAAILPVNTRWCSICHGDGKFVAIAYNSDSSAYSTDGEYWTRIVLPFSGYWRGVAYGNDIFVAVAQGNKAAYSTDGLSWTETNISSANWYSVTYGNGRFVATSSDNTKVAYSTNGIDWTLSNLPESGNWNSVIYGNGVFVTLNRGSDIAAYSTNGIDWNLTTLPLSSNWNSVAYGNSMFVSPAYDSDTFIYSTDGITWQIGTLPTVGYWQSIAYGDKFVILPQSSNVVLYSADAVNWETATLPASGDWSSVVYANDRFVAVRNGTDRCAYSVNIDTTDHSWPNYTRFVECTINGISGIKDPATGIKKCYGTLSLSANFKPPASIDLNDQPLYYNIRFKNSEGKTLVLDADLSRMSARMLGFQGTLAYGQAAKEIALSGVYADFILSNATNGDDRYLSVKIEAINLIRGDLGNTYWIECQMPIIWTYE